MKLYTIIISLYFMNNFIFTSDTTTETCPSGCGRVEHIFSKSIANKYAEQHFNSGLTINNDNEGVPTNIVDAVMRFGHNIQLIDKNGNPIIPQPFKDTQNIVLPMYKSNDFNLRKSIVATIAMNNTSTSDEILQELNNQYKLSTTIIQKHTAINNSITQDGVVLCAPCFQEKNK